MLYKKFRILVSCIFIAFSFTSCSDLEIKYLIPSDYETIKNDSFSAGVIGYASHMYLIKSHIKVSDLKEYPLDITLLTFADDVSMDGWKSCESLEYSERLESILNNLIYQKKDEKAYITEFCSDVLKRKKDFYFVSYYRLDLNKNSRSFGEEIYYNMYFLDIKKSKLYTFLWAF